MDAVLNHMAAAHTTHDEGTGGNYADTANRNFGAVPYTKDDFHSSCRINNWNDPVEVTQNDLVYSKGFLILINFTCSRCA